MIKTIYHGSKDIIKKPFYGGGKSYNDYGFGFYCTESTDMAKEWAVSADSNGYANCYQIDCSNLNICNLNDEKYCILHWLSVLLQNRDFEVTSPLAAEAKEYLVRYFTPDISDADIIIGYRADDSYFSFARDFISGAISYRQLRNAMALGKLGQQFVLKSERAFARIKFTGCETVLSSEWFAKKALRDKAARREYFDLERNRRARGDLYITAILDEEMRENDSRLR